MIRFGGGEIGAIAGDSVKGLVDGRPFGIMSVTEFGAVGDGVTDDTAAIQQALNNVVGSSVFFPPGSYLVENLELSQSLTLFSSQGTATLKLPNGSTGRILRIYNTSNVIVDGLSFDMNKANTANGGADTNQQGLYILAENQSHSNIRVRNCSFRDGHRSAIYFRSTGTGVLTDVVFENCQAANCLDGYFGLFMSDARIENCSAVSMHGGDGIHLLGCNNIAIVGGRYNENRRHGIFFDQCTGFLVSGAMCNFNGSLEDQEAWGIVVSIKSKEFTISNNLCVGNYWGGISVDVSDGTATFWPTNGVVQGNICMNGTVRHGIYTNRALNLLIKNNVCSNNALSGILDGSKETYIGQNECTDNAQYGIFVGGISENAKVVDNQVYGNTIGQYGVDPGATGVVRYNTPLLKLRGAATVDVASIAAGDIATFSITVPGAVVGDHVVLAPPSAIEAGLVWSAFVNAADTVTVRLHNTTGLAIDPASNTWGAMVIPA